MTSYWWKLLFQVVLNFHAHRMIPEVERENKTIPYNSNQLIESENEDMYSEMQLSNLLWILKNILLIEVQLDAKYKSMLRHTMYCSWLHQTKCTCSNTKISIPEKTFAFLLFPPFIHLSIPAQSYITNPKEDCSDKQHQSIASSCSACVLQHH